MALPFHRESKSKMSALGHIAIGTCTRIGCIGCFSHFPFKKSSSNFMASGAACAIGYSHTEWTLRVQELGEMTTGPAKVNLKTFRVETRDGKICVGVPRITKEPFMIRKLKSGKYRLYSRKKNPKTGKRRNLGTFKTKAAAKKHEKAVQYFKQR
jgi:hypothetical protein